MGRIMNPDPILFGLDLALEIAGDALELGNHALDLRNLAPPLIDLKLFSFERASRVTSSTLTPRCPDRRGSTRLGNIQPSDRVACPNEVSFRLPRIGLVYRVHRARAASVT
jgi:hypothetical protein